MSGQNVLSEAFVLTLHTKQVTQEVLLAQRTIVLAGIEAHGLIALARTYRSLVQHHGGSAFENIADVIFQRRHRYPEGSLYRVGLEGWGLVNLLYRFRHKDCAIRRDRIYSLLALSKEGKVLNVDYSAREEQLLRQVLTIRESSICLCSTAIVAHALHPWDFEEAEVGTLPFAKIHMYGSSIIPTGCPFCSNWVPSSWKKKKGLVFCLGTACSDTQGHIFWEHRKANEEQKLDKCDTTLADAEDSALFHLQLRRNNKSQLLCREGAGLTVSRSAWNHVYSLQFTLRTLIEVLLYDPQTSDMGLNACGNLWPSATNTAIADEGRLKLCDKN